MLSSGSQHLTNATLLLLLTNAILTPNVLASSHTDELTTQETSHRKNHVISSRNCRTKISIPICAGEELRTRTPPLRAGTQPNPAEPAPRVTESWIVCPEIEPTSPSTERAQLEPGPLRETWLVRRRPHRNPFLQPPDVPCWKNHDVPPLPRPPKMIPSRAALRLPLKGCILDCPP